MKKIFILLSLVIASVFAFSQGAPFPNYQPQGSPTTRWSQQGAVQGMKGIINGVYPDTLTANITSYIDFYPGAQIFTTSDTTIWVRNSTATKWIKNKAGDVSITSFTFNTDSSLTICFGSGVCITIPINNFTTVVNNVIQNFNDSTIFNINDSTLLVCVGSGSARVCDTVHLGSSLTYHIFNDTTNNLFYLVTCDTVQNICVGDSCYQQQVCDSILIPKPQIPTYQNGLRVLPNSLIREFGNDAEGEANMANLLHRTWLYTNYSYLTIQGRPTDHEPFAVDQVQWSQLSSSIASFHDYGKYPPTGADGNNKVNLYLNYFNPFHSDTTGFFYNRIGYGFLTNSRGRQEHYLLDDDYSKQTGILFHTLDTNNIEAVTIVGNQHSSPYNFGNTPMVDSTLQDAAIAVFKTNGQQQNPKYGVGTFVFPPKYLLGVDSVGNIVETQGTGDVITIINDSTINICSFGTNLCDTFIVNNIGVLQTVTIINDSTLLVCDSVGVCDTLHIPQTVLSQPVTANNGLIMSTPTNVQLGSPQQPGAPLLHQTYIDAGALYSLNINGSVGGTNWVFSSTNTGTGSGVVGNAISGAGVAGIATTGTGGSFRADAGQGITATSNSSFAGIFTINPTTTNTVADAISIQRQVNGTAGDGVGQSVNFVSETSDGILWTSNRLISKWTTANTPTRVSQYVITGVNNAITADLFTLSGNGALKMNKYGVGSFTSGTGVYLAAFKSDGTIMEYPTGGLPGGGNLITADNGLTANTATNVQLGATASGANSPLLHNTYINGSTFFLNMNSSSTTATLVVDNSTASTNAALDVNQTGGGTGIEVNSIDREAIIAQSVNNIGVYSSSNIAEAFSGLAQSSTVAILTRQLNAVGNVAADVLDIRTTSGVTADVGLGGIIVYKIQTTTNNGRRANELISNWTNATDATRTSTLKFTGVLSATTVDLLTLAGDGSVKLRPITATAASAITPAEGMLVMVSSTDATFVSIGIWAYQNGAWKAL